MNDQRLDETKDSDEPLLIQQMLHLLSELERYSAIGETDSEDDSEAFNFELASNHGSFSKSQTYRLPRSKSKAAENIASKIEVMMSDDEELNICVLLKLLNNKLK